MVTSNAGVCPKSTPSPCCISGETNPLILFTVFISLPTAVWDYHDTVESMSPDAMSDSTMDTGVSEVDQVRTEFPETWFWSEMISGYSRILHSAALCGDIKLTSCVLLNWCMCCHCA